MNNSAFHILVVDDDDRIRALVKQYLEENSFIVTTAIDALDAKKKLDIIKFDILVLDIMMPGKSGLSLTKEIKKTNSTPIILLTAKGETVDRIKGLEIGADDYLVKPFGMHELLARVKAILRRVNLESENSVSIRSRNLEKTSDVLISGNLVLDAQRHRSSLDQVELDLKPREFQLLFLFMSNVGLVLTRNKILDELWGQEFIGDLRSVDVHVRWLRVKLEDDSSNPKRLVTIRGVGYRFEG